MASVSLRLPDEVSQRLDHLAELTGRSKTFYMIEAIREHLDDLFRQSPFRSKGRPASLPTLIDRHPDLREFLAFRKTVEQTLIEEMQAVDTRGIEPMSHAQDVSQRLREDAVTETDQRELFQSIAPQVEAGLYLVPQVIE